MGKGLPIFKVMLLACLLITSVQAFAEGDESSGLEIGFENAELKQNHYRNLGPSNFTFFIGNEFESAKLENWAWRLSLIKVELSKEHLRDEDSVCCINGDRSNLEGEFEQYRLYFDYLPNTKYLELLNNRLNIKFITSLGIGYNRVVTRDAISKDEHDVGAITAGAIFRVKTAFYDRFFIEPAIDIGFNIYKNNDVNDTVGGAELDRPEHVSFTLLTYLGYIF